VHAVLEHADFAAWRGSGPQPEGLRLCTFPPVDRRAELPFTLRLRDPQRGVPPASTVQTCNRAAHPWRG